MCESGLNIIISTNHIAIKESQSLRRRWKKSKNRFLNHTGLCRPRMISKSVSIKLLSWTAGPPLPTLASSKLWLEIGGDDLILSILFAGSLKTYHLLEARD